MRYLRILSTCLFSVTPIFLFYSTPTLAFINVGNLIHNVLEGSGSNNKANSVTNTLSTLGNPNAITTGLLIPYNQLGFSNRLMLPAITQTTLLATQPVFQSIQTINNHQIMFVNMGNNNLISYGFPLENTGNRAAVASSALPQNPNNVFDRVINTSAISPITSASVKNGDLVLASSPNQSQHHHRNLQASQNGLGAGVIGKSTAINNTNNKQNSTTSNIANVSRNGVGAGAVGRGRN